MNQHKNLHTETLLSPAESANKEYKGTLRFYWVMHQSLLQSLSIIE